MREADHTASSTETANSSQVSGRSGQRNGKNSAPNATGGSSRTATACPGPAEVGGQQRELQVPRPGQVDRDVAAAHPVGELAVAPQQDHGEQPLPEPHVGEAVAGVVAGDAAPLGQHRGQHGHPQQPEHGVGEQPGQGCLPVAAYRRYPARTSSG